ncbi:hypothetical protein [Siphonobacter sp. SORGH_AS_1065]|uniref:hypothetical protein n=1 Tax=Siphonobacter sp. SORGH_AS_1065 TaxID=3041795 RepID=UPI00278449DF|nr:hypothetical protein [Siphonobacter sp. SORGH_AS_1065]MDQ1088154.1 hypothetical protein [Siphonobacter sp. SORGH_AS_1065]
MKKVFFTLSSFFLSSISLFAQIPANTKILGFGGSFRYGNMAYPNADIHNSSLNFSPELTSGKFTKENTAEGWIVNPTVMYNYTNWSPALSIQHFNRKYVSLTPGFYLFGEATAGAQANLRFMERNAVYQTYQVSAGVNLGLTYFYKNDWSLEAKANVATVYASHYRSPITPTQNLVSLQSNLPSNFFELSLVKYIGSQNEKSTLLTSKRDSLYQVNQRFITGDISATALFNENNNYLNNNTQALQAGFSIGRFVTTTYAKGFGITARFNKAPEYTSIEEWYPINSKTAGFSIYKFHEYYFPIAKKLSLVANVRINASYAYAKEEAREQITTHSLTLFPSIIPAIQYQINDRWALTGLIGSFQIGSVHASYEKSAWRGDLIRGGISFDPNYTLNNSGVSLRYFLKK